MSVDQAAARLGISADAVYITGSSAATWEHVAPQTVAYASRSLPKLRQCTAGGLQTRIT